MAPAPTAFVLIPSVFQKSHRTFFKKELAKHLVLIQLLQMCIHTTITFSCGHKFHKRESTTPECVLDVHDTPPVDEKRDGQCDGCKARNTLQLPAGKSEKKGLLRRALSVVSGASAKKKGAREEARKEEE